MSGSGAPSVCVNNPDGMRVGIVAAQWHARIVDGLLAGALRALTEAGPVQHTVLRVPGVFELPVAAKALASSGCDAVIALGVVIRGDTPHFDYICQAATMGLTTVAANTGTPVGFGVLTCDTEQQAQNRAGLPGSAEDKGYEAAAAALATAASIRHLTQERTSTPTAPFTPASAGIC